MFNVSSACSVLCFGNLSVKVSVSCCVSLLLVGQQGFKRCAGKHDSVEIECLPVRVDSCLSVIEEVILSLPSAVWPVRAESSCFPSTGTYIPKELTIFI